MIRIADLLACFMQIAGLGVANCSQNHGAVMKAIVWVSVVGCCAELAWNC